MAALPERDERRQIMLLREAIQKKGTAHNISNGRHFEVIRATIWGERGPGAGYKLDEHAPADIGPLKERCNGYDLADIERFIENARKDPNSSLYGLDPLAWTAPL
jgi:hypothetical protein